jgi:type IV pilus assembly protein PilB
MTVAVPTKLAGLLEKCQLFTPAQVEQLLNQQQQTGKSMAELVVGDGFAREDDFLKALAAAMNLPYVRAGDLTIDKAALERLPTKAVFQYNVLPIAMEEGALRVATNDPFMPGLMDALRLASGLPHPARAQHGGDIEKAAKKLYGVGAKPWTA